MLKQFDVAIIGGGAAGLSAGLYLGLSLRETIIFDNHTNRNRVTQHSHGFLTQDGVSPEQFRNKAASDLEKFPHVQIKRQGVEYIVRSKQQTFYIHSENAEIIEAKKVILASGISGEYQRNLGIETFYGSSIFSCPYCDGWPISGQPLFALVEEEEAAEYFGRLIFNWSKDLVVLTNGYDLSPQLVSSFQNKGIVVITEKIKAFKGQEGQLETVEFISGQKLARTAGFIMPKFKRTTNFAEKLDCDFNQNQEIIASERGLTSQAGVYVAGEYRTLRSNSLIISAAEGSLAAIGVNSDLIMEETF